MNVSTKIKPFFPVYAQGGPGALVYISFSILYSLR